MLHCRRHRAAAEVLAAEAGERAFVVTGDLATGAGRRRRGRPPPSSASGASTCGSTTPACSPWPRSWRCRPRSSRPSSTATSAPSFHGTRAAASRMADGGAIVNVASVAGPAREARYRRATPRPRGRFLALTRTLAARAGDRAVCASTPSHARPRRPPRHGRPRLDRRRAEEKRASHPARSLRTSRRGIAAATASSSPSDESTTWLGHAGLVVDGGVLAPTHVVIRSRRARIRRWPHRWPPRTHLVLRRAAP